MINHINQLTKKIMVAVIFQMVFFLTAFADGEGKNKVAVMALDGATSTSVFTEKPLYAIAEAYAELSRGDHAIKIKVKTSGLPAGAYTNWWMIFNQPEECAAEICQIPDFFNPLTGASLMWAAGKIVESAKVTFHASLEEGEIPGELPFGSGLTNASNAQIRFVIKWHGPASTDPTILYSQLHYINDVYCETDPEPGLTGLKRCPDLQSSATFMP